MVWRGKGRVAHVGWPYLTWCFPDALADRRLPDCVRSGVCLWDPFVVRLWPSLPPRRRGAGGAFPHQPLPLTGHLTVRVFWLQVGRMEDLLRDAHTQGHNLLGRCDTPELLEALLQVNPQQAHYPNCPSC